MRIKAGTIRDDGMIFFGYQSTGKEYWALPEKYAHMLEKRRARVAAWNKANPGKQRAISAAWDKANPEKKRAARVAWVKANPEKQRVSGAAWIKANPERKRAAHAAWAKANPEKIRAYNVAWSKANREKKRAIFVAWSKANPEKTRLRSAKRRAAKLKALSPDANKAFVAGFYAIASRVSKCLGISHDVDHIVPLALGGSHCHRNLQVIPASWNYRKHARYDYPLPDCYRTDGWMIV